MSTDFVVFKPEEPENCRWLWSMGNGRADRFRAFADVIATHYGLTSGIEDRRYNPLGEYNVEPEPFCALVEAVFADPVDLFSGWAQYAADMYEGIKRHRYHWAWDAWPPRPSFRPHYGPYNSPKDWGAAWQEMTLRLPPGEVRFETEEGKVVAYMPRRRATLFVSIAGFALGDTPSGLSELEGGVCRVEAEPFCRYVELLVRHQMDWYQPWVEHAAGMYEVIQGKWYNWIWTPHKSSYLGFTPVRQLPLAPWQASGRTIAPDWWAKMSQVSSEQSDPGPSEDG